MAAKKKPVDKVRASRDGHEYHEIWTARRALQLLPPNSSLTAIAIEGLSPRDQAAAASETVEIADLTLYYGQPTFEQATRTTISQFKYSFADRNTEVRAAQVKTTLRKFSTTFKDYRRKYGAVAVTERLDFELVTNRPIYRPFIEALEALKSGAALMGEAAKQSKQVAAATGLKGKDLSEFAGKLCLNGLSGSLSAGKRSLSGLIVDWTGTNDALASSRLGKIKDLVSEKAGLAGAQKNLILRTEVLAALDIADIDELLPCKPALPKVGKIVERQQLSSAIELVKTLSKPLLIHAAGGVGKTVFMESLTGAIAEEAETVFFDCFGGGAYRSPSDARHLPKKGLVHIANTLSFRGLCDPLLPYNSDTEGLLVTFRKRLGQCVKTLKAQAPGRSLALFIDAIDNAKVFADTRSQECFPNLLLESLFYEPIEGVKVIASCRTERKPSTAAHYVDLPLLPFTARETADYLKARIASVSAAEIQVAQARSGGNARVLEYLTTSDRGLLDPSEINKAIELDDLIQQRINSALETAIERGYQQKDIDAFLAGLAVLPPPVPLDEYASAQGLQLSEIESFASDLSPLLERTNQGLMFRDEPTETLIWSRYSTSEDALRKVAANLNSRQDTSVYAARALPPLLQQLKDGDQLFKLAFDDRIPAEIKSTVGKRNVRYARLKAAALHASNTRDIDKLVRLVIELSTVAAVDERGAKYILDYPDLVVVSNDSDARRRLYEARTSWPGARHARLAVANTLEGDSGEAYRHIRAANEWLSHYRRSEHNDPTENSSPDRLDVAAIPFYLVCEGRLDDAQKSLARWRAWYSYEVGRYLFEYLHLAKNRNRVVARRIAKFVSGLDDTGSIAAAISFCGVSDQTVKSLLTRLARKCKTEKSFSPSDFYSKRGTYDLQDGLRKACAIALARGQVKEALDINKEIPTRVPDVWSFREASFRGDIFPFVFSIALRASALGKPVLVSDLLPKDLLAICSKIRKTLENKAYVSKALEAVNNAPLKKREDTRGSGDPLGMSYELKQDAETFLNKKLSHVLALTVAFQNILSASTRTLDKAVVSLIDAWGAARKYNDTYGTGERSHMFQVLGLDIALFVLWVRKDVSKASIESLLKTVAEQPVSPYVSIEIISMLSQREDLWETAGRQAVKAREIIEAENDVSERARLMAALARALLPASIDEASEYFRNGLDQMDAIGSGDYSFTNDLLLFASTLEGEELEEKDFHTLSNIAELNLGDEPHKFFWVAYAKGMSKAAGIRGLAKLSRWDDRSKIRMSYTLLPSLIALVHDGKIDPESAVILNRLADPVEYYEGGTSEFIKALRSRGIDGSPALVREIIGHFLEENPGTPSERTVGELASLAKAAFGNGDDTVKYLASAAKSFEVIRHTKNDNRNYHGKKSDLGVRNRRDDRDKQNLKDLRSLARKTNPCEDDKLASALAVVSDMQQVWDIRGEFFKVIREKVPFSSYSQYIRNIARSEHLNWYWKIGELEECKKLWGGSSTALQAAYASIAIPLLSLHAEDIVEKDGLSGYKLKAISEMTGVGMADLALELIKVLSQPDVLSSGSVWLGLACFFGPEASAGEGQLALKRLLNSEAAALANRVTDGLWQAGLYPENNLTKVASGLIWRQLGSPRTEDRWRAAHCIRSLARHGRWDVVSCVVNMAASTEAGAFQARELGFYYMHARLWLLIAIARLALDYPQKVSLYSTSLINTFVDDPEPHVLMRHFAARAVVACIDAGALRMSKREEKKLRTIDESPFPRLRRKIRKGGDFYQGRPKGTPKPSFEFHLDYEFHKGDVDNLANVFGKGCWEVSDMISEVVRQLDSSATSMYESKGRESGSRRDSYGMNDRYQTYGQQLGWHAMFIAAGKLWKKYPITDDWWPAEDSNPWITWLHREGLTRTDGFWLSDATDRTPLDTAQILLRKAKEGLVLTGEKDQILNLVGISSEMPRELIVEGDWFSSDAVKISISSVLVDPKETTMLVRKLLKERPISAWLPTYSENESDSEYTRSDKNEYAPWIVNRSGESRIDKQDPYGVGEANLRPRIAAKYAAQVPLTRADPFCRGWMDGKKRIVVRAEAWGRGDTESEDGPHPGVRLLCSSSTLKKILKAQDMDLVILVVLRRSEKKSYDAESTWTHTVAVVSINRKYEVAYHRGRVNHQHKNRW